MVQILSVSLEPEAVEQIAQRVVQLLGNTQQAPAQAPAQNYVQPSVQVATTAQPAPVVSTAQPVQNGSADYDPWAGTGATRAPVQQPVQPYQPQAPQQPQQAPQGGPVCAHGPMRYVPGGFSRTSNRPYAAFYGCPQPKDAPDKCRSVKA